MIESVCDINNNRHFLSCCQFFMFSPPISQSSATVFRSSMKEALSSQVGWLCDLLKVENDWPQQAHSSSFPIMTLARTDAQPLAWQMFLNVLSSNSLFITGELMERRKWRREEMMRTQAASRDASSAEESSWLFLFNCQKRRGTCVLCTCWHRALTVLLHTVFVIMLKVEELLLTAGC